MNIAIAPATLDDLATAANNEHALLAGDAERMIKRAIRIGELLTEAKAQVAHGEWIPWIEKNLTFGRNQAARYMRISSNGTRVSHLIHAPMREVVALLAEPKEEPAEPGPPAPTASGEPTEWEADQEDAYNNDPELEQELIDVKLESRRRQGEIDNLGAEIVEKRAEARGLAGVIKTKGADIFRLTRRNVAVEAELEELRKLKADKARVEKTLGELHELEKRKQDLFADAESTQLVHQVLVRSREFFTRECMQIPALNLRPESIRVMKQDFSGLVELVENWLDAIKSRFLEDA